MTTVFCNGCFDLLHSGHLSFLQFAREQGSHLIVGLNSDESICGNKGPTRPIMPYGARFKMLKALRCVDAVVGFHEPTPYRLIMNIRPDVYAIGEDAEEFDEACQYVRAYGRVVQFDQRLESTTDIIRRVSR